MTSFKRWFGAGAIVLVALALVACPALVPKATGSIPAMTFAHDDMTARTVALGSYFTDSRDATYKPDSSNPAVATASIAGTTLTVTPKGEGTTTVTVTATSSTGRDSATQSFDVTVEPEPDPVVVVNLPVVARTQIDNMSIVAGMTKTLTLSDYYLDPDAQIHPFMLTYTARSNDTSIATVSDPDPVTSEITITAVAVGGPAIIAVTAADATGIPAPQSFAVTVTAENQAPVWRTSTPIGDVPYTDFRREATLPYTLSEVFRDPDNDALVWGAESGDSSVVSVMVDQATSVVTLTAESVGMTDVTVSATDIHGASVEQTFNVQVGSQAPELTDVSDVVALVLRDGYRMKTLDLKRYFSDPEGDTLTFAIGDMGDSSIATVTEPDDGEITITAVAEGDTDIEVTAADSDNDPVSLMLDVRVSAHNYPPEVVSAIDDQSLMLDVTPTKTFDVMGNFSDMDSGPSPLTYTPTSSDDSIVTASADGSMITIEAHAVGMAEITVTASDGADSVPAGFTVTVTAPAAPTWLKEIPDVTLEHDDMTKTFMLEEYFSGATMYDPNSHDDNVVTAEVDDEQTTLTITRVGTGAGNTVVEITPQNSGGNGPTQSITVMVKAARQPPAEKADMMLDDSIRLNLAATPPTKVYNLDMHFEDPDGSAALKYSTTTDDSEKVAVYKTPGDGDPAVTPADSHKTATGNMVTLHGRAAGSATITVTVTDSDGLTATETIDVTVVTTNAAPTLAASPPDLLDYIGADRLKLSDEPKKAINDAAINLHFADTNLADVPAGDLLRFTVKYVADGGTITSDKLDDDDIVATATIEPDTWDGDLGGTDKFTVTVTPKKAGDAHEILIVATDLAGEMIARTISVQVNHAPVAKGAEVAPATPGTLTKLSESYDDLGMSSGFQTVSATAHQVVLVAEGGGYFSDEDNATAELNCRYNTSGDAIFAEGFPAWEDATVRRQLNLATNATTAFAKQGTAHIEVWCTDTSGESSMTDTLTIKVTSSGSIH